MGGGWNKSLCKCFNGSQFSLCFNVLRRCCIDGAGMEPQERSCAELDGCQFDERGGVVAETWRALRVPHASSVKPGAANCCHCLFAWSPAGTPTSPGPRRRPFNNDGSVAARRSVTLRTVRSEDHQTRHLGIQYTGSPMFFPR